MPNVRGKNFGYGPKGKKAARKYAKKHGLKVKHKDNPGYYAESKTEMNSYDRIYTLLTESKMSGATRAYRKLRRASTKHNVRARAFDDSAAAIEQKRTPNWAKLRYFGSVMRKKHAKHKRLGAELFAKAVKNKKIIPQSVERGVTRMKDKERGY
tara:strand:+ start:2837 stop:3298 length:462 start_codon:yes stop_codon:yes gene_type:complete